MQPSHHRAKETGRGTVRTSYPKPLELLRAKLDVPPPRPGLVERTRLVARLSRERNGRVVSVVAPAGYGKTVVLAQWAARDPRQFAWVSLDHRDNDPVVFLTYVAEALNAGSTVDRAVFKGLSGPGDSLWARGSRASSPRWLPGPNRSCWSSTTCTSSRTPSASTPWPRCSSTCREARSSCSAGVPRPGWGSRSFVPTESCSSSGPPSSP